MRLVMSDGTTSSCRAAVEKLPGHLPHHAERHQGRGDGLRKAGPLPSRNHRCASVVWFGCRLRRGGDRRALERGAAMTTIILHGRKIVGGASEGEALVTHE